LIFVYIITFDIQNINNANVPVIDNDRNETAVDDDDDDDVLFAAAWNVVSSDRVQLDMLVRAAGQGTRV